MTILLPKIYWTIPCKVTGGCGKQYATQVLVWCNRDGVVVIWFLKVPVSDIVTCIWSASHKAVVVQ